MKRSKRIKLEAFEEKDFDRLISWVKNQEDLVQFAGPIFSFPLSHDQLLDYIKNKDKRPFRVKDIESDQIIGHCEINLGNQHPRLSRILIGDENNRGKGIGSEVVKAMVKLIKKDYTCSIIDLNVFAWNKKAIRCYENNGFHIIEENTDVLMVHGIKWTRLNMQLK